MKPYTYDNYNTKTLRELYGSLRLSVIEHNKNVRTSLISNLDGLPLTLAIIKFSNKKFSDTLSIINSAAEKGMFIGDAIFISEAKIVKKYFCNFKLDKAVTLKNDLGKNFDFVYGRFYELNIEVDNLTEKYGDMCEIINTELVSMKKHITKNDKRIFKKLKSVLIASVISLSTENIQIFGNGDF